jgi:hypothetical protein
MAYVLETRCWRSGGRTRYAYTLHHMSRSELRRAIADSRFQPGVFYETVSGAYAHRYVRRDGHHTTPLYLDTYENRIRFARG